MAIKPTSRISPKKSTGNMRLTALIIISAVLCVNRALGTSTAQENSHKSYGRDLCAVRTNLVYDCLAIPSLGVEIPFGRGLSVGLDGYYAWCRSGVIFERTVDVGDRQTEDCVDGAVLRSLGIGQALMARRASC